jgi:hypothetical protein
MYRSFFDLDQRSAAPGLDRSPSHFERINSIDRFFGRDTGTMNSIAPAITPMAKPNKRPPSAATAAINVTYRVARGRLFSIEAEITGIFTFSVEPWLGMREVYQFGSFCISENRAKLRVLVKYSIRQNTAQISGSFLKSQRIAISQLFRKDASLSIGLQK